VCVCVCVIKQDCVWSLRVPGERLVSRQAVTEHILKAKTCLIPVALVHLPLSKALSLSPLTFHRFCSELHSSHSIAAGYRSAAFLQRL